MSDSPDWLIGTIVSVLLLTSAGVASAGLKEVKGCRGTVRHEQELATTTGGRRRDPPNYGIQERLQVAALTPQQRWGVPEGAGWVIACKLWSANQQLCTLSYQPFINHSGYTHSLFSRGQHFSK